MVIAGSLSACGGGGSVTSIADMIDQPAEAVAQHDTNNDGVISIDEAIAAWNSLSQADKELLADAAHTTVVDIDQLIADIDSSVDVEIPVEDIIEVIEEVAPVVVEETPVEEVVEEPTVIVIEGPLIIGDGETLIVDSDETVIVVEETPEPVDPTIGTFLEGVDLTENQGVNIETISTQIVNNIVNDAYNQAVANNVGWYAEDEAWWAYTNLGTLQNDVHAAHQEGWTGTGVNITIIDSFDGTNTSHGDIVRSTAGLIAPGANIQTVQATTDLYYDAITEVQEANVISISVGGGSWERDNDELLDGSHVVTIAAQHNNAVGMPYHSEATANCVNDGSMEVATCNTWAAQDSRFINNDTTLFVGEVEFVDGQWVTPSWSNVAGGIDNFIVTESFDPHGTTSNAGGNSLAAPRAAGAAALVQSKFSNINADQTTDILLGTANDNFAGFDSNLHGAGLLDIGAALSPVGSLD